MSVQQFTRPARNVAISAAVFLAGLLVPIASTSAATLQTFSVPAATSTSPVTVNNAGTAAGWSSQSNFYRGFVRTSDGTLTSFDCPGVGTAQYDGTIATSINNNAITVGYCLGVSGTNPGFIRQADGAVQLVSLAGYGVSLYSINDGNVAVGARYETTPPYACEGLIRAANGNMGLILYGTETCVEAWSVNRSAEVVGTLTSMQQWFVRPATGIVSAFTVPGAVTPSGDVYINDAGQIAGDFLDANSISHGFLRGTDGSVIVFDAPGAGTAAYQGTYVHGITASGAVAGNAFGASTQIGYIRSASGTFSEFFQTANLPYTYVGGISSKANITGNVTTTTSQSPGFLVLQ